MNHGFINLPCFCFGCFLVISNPAQLMIFLNFPGAPEAPAFRKLGDSWFGGSWGWWFSQVSINSWLSHTGWWFLEYVLLSPWILGVSWSNLKPPTSILFPSWLIEPTIVGTDTNELMNWYSLFPKTIKWRVKVGGGRSHENLDIQKWWLMLSKRWLSPRK